MQNAGRARQHNRANEKLEKYQGLIEELERTWKVKVKVVPVVIGALGAVTPKLEEWLQHIPGTTSELSVQKSAVPGTAKILRRTLKLPGHWWRTRWGSPIPPTYNPQGWEGNFNNIIYNICIHTLRVYMRVLTCWMTLLKIQGCTGRLMLKCPGWCEGCGAAI